LFSPKEPPPPEPEWSEQETDVIHLTDENFKTILKKKKSALVFFYAPCKKKSNSINILFKKFSLGCGHCKKAKPLFTNAAATLKENPKVNDLINDLFSSMKIFFRSLSVLWIVPKVNQYAKNMKYKVIQQ
jgi:thiol-disulfide isomerase/thioredoxin